MTFMVGDKLVKDVLRWLSPAGPWKDHNVACELRHIGTAEWFIRSNTFSEWRAFIPGSLLWVHGKRSFLPSSYAFSETDRFFLVAGAGKGVFWYVKLSIFPSWELILLASSAIIQDIDAMQKAGLASLAFFYFDSTDDQKKDRRGLLSSLLVQLCYQSDSYCDVLSRFYVEHSSGHRHPSDDALVGCLKDLLTVSGQAPVYLILDGLNECSNSSASPSPREDVLKLLKELIESQFLDLRICVTSRLEADIRDVLAPLAFRSISLHNEFGHENDIDNYIKFIVNMDPVMQRWEVDGKERVIKVLVGHANGR
jgi:hypothetical protein